MTEAHLPTPRPPQPITWRGRRRGWLHRRRGPKGRRGDPAHPTRIGLWLPLTPLWLILSPFALLLAPLVAFAPRLLPDNPRAREIRTAINIHPYRAAFALGAVLLSMSGTVVDVEAPGATIHIRIF